MENEGTAALAEEELGGLAPGATTEGDPIRGVDQGRGADLMDGTAATEQAAGIEAIRGVHRGLVPETDIKL